MSCPPEEVGENVGRYCEDATAEAPSWTGKSITSLSLYRRSSVLKRLDIVPFAALYLILSAFWLSNKTQSFTFALGLGASVVCHLLTFLFQYWLVQAHAFISWEKLRPFRSSSLRESEVYALVRPRPHRGKTELVPLLQSPDGRVHFSFQKRSYEFDSSTNCFRKVPWPTKLPLSGYENVARSCSGLSEDAVQKGYSRFGPNMLEIPVPSFRELYKENLLAPFFVFQVFCVFLWMLDSYWQYSLMTLFMMLVFEATVVSNRLKSLRDLRGMRNKPRHVFVYRSKRWVTVSSHEILPGDILSVPRSGNPEDLVPCDVLILGGTAVVNEAMLTGESAPLMKEALMPLQVPDKARLLDIKNADKNHLLFGGTRVLTHTSPGVTEATPASRPPDNGCICFALRTGFGSSQGKLMRTILYSTDSVSANSMEAALFILFLLVFALAASGYVLTMRYSDDSDSRYKLLLRCVLIITSVVPPELPMQLSLAVNASLISLSKARIFCTEPFRIPFAGKVDVCCFDKTGTLTTDSIHAVGVALPSTSAKSSNVISDEPSFYSESENAGETAGDEVSTHKIYPVIPVNRASSYAAAVLAACHSLVHVDNDLVGDPLEIAALEAVEWLYGRSGTAVPKSGGANAISCRIIKRYRFSSSLQRMSIIAESHGRLLPEGPKVLTKGSPEMISQLLEAGGVPDGYAETASHLSRRGYRVLALAYRDLSAKLTASEVHKMERTDAERDLKFAGFVCFECPLRADSRKVIRMLKNASHSALMITGDSTLTAAHVARQVCMCTRNTLILEKSTIVPGTLEWFSAATGKRRKKFSAALIPELSAKYDLCVSGPALESAIRVDKDILTKLRHIKVFARMSPNQKETVLTALNENGLVTLMCGDGTNDVGALKQAHVGVALLSGADLSSPGSSEAHDVQTARAPTLNGSGASRERAVKSSRRPPIARDTREHSRPSQSSLSLNRDASKEAQRDELMLRVQELSDSLADAEDQPPLVKLGDASVASPFTSRRMTIDSCTSIIRQGRCTLATTMQMYQILALNCLISAYALSVLYLDGVAFGDKQMTVTGIIMAIAFCLISRSKPLKKLSAERPSSSIFAPELFLSLLGQFAIHVGALLYCTSVATKYEPFGPKNNIDAAFRPSVMNTVVFLLSIAQQVSVFMVNYKGRPFMQSMVDNRMLLNSLLAVSGIVVLCTLEFSPDLNEFMELTPWPDSTVQTSVAMCILLDFILALVWDKLIVFAFLRQKLPEP